VAAKKYVITVLEGGVKNRYYSFAGSQKTIIFAIKNANSVVL
jgi:hypothetical protein